MLKAVHSMSRRYSMRNGGLGTIGSLAISFLNALTLSDEFSLVNVRHTYTHIHTHTQPFSTCQQTPKAVRA